ncbi:ComF family protein [candidate division WWE3 bacterium]|jgi:ComF family protein|uniref:ComF family protein n=1 Tax=candidate division WWE3 bacterium TaxID=2053526 RepID=A0A3A4ZJ13_UNCKA|nr:MAG: ComF family protein [candidate division WWE3 bacterium]
MVTMEYSECLVCGKFSEDGTTHLSCRNDVVPSSFVSVFKYCSLVRSVIRRAKYARREFLGLRIISEAAAEIVKEEFSQMTKYVLIPVPISDERLRTRGFNQVTTITKALSKKTSMVVNTRILLRNVDSRPQYTNNRLDRYDNVKGAFSIRKGHENLVTHGKFLLADDICTSGATLLEASKTLYENGASDVKCFALSRKV